MRFYYKLTHSYKSATKPRKHCFHIGVYSDKEKALAAIEELKQKSGFSEYPNGFKVSKQLYILKPRLLDRTYWVDGFFTYTY